MNKKILISFVCFFIVSLLYGQRIKDGNHEVFLSVGPTFYSGQMGKTTKDYIKVIPDYITKTVGIGISGGYRYKSGGPFNYSGNISYLNFGAQNSIDNPYFKGYGFTTNMLTFGAKTEVTIFKMFSGKRRGKRVVRVGSKRYVRDGYKFYFLLGVECFFANVTAKEYLKTDYRFNQFNWGVGFPFGFGLRYDYNHRLVFSLEIITRITTSDKIDGLETTTRFNDMYHNAFVTVAYKLKQKRKFKRKRWVIRH